jgi:opacity protein-like surface antigen
MITKESFIMAVLIAVFLTYSIESGAQEDSLPKFGIGLKMGVNSSVLGNNAGLNFESGKGWLIGLVFRKPINEQGSAKLDFSIELLLEHKSAYLTSSYYDVNGLNLRQGDLYSSFDYFSLPVAFSLFPFVRRIVYLEFGFYLAYLDNFYFSESSFTKFNSFDFGLPDHKPLSPEKFNSFDYGFNLGLGFNLSISPKWDMNLAYRYSYGLANINDDDDFREYTFSHRANSITIGLLRKIGH